MYFHRICLLLMLSIQSCLARLSRRRPSLRCNGEPPNMSHYFHAWPVQRSRSWGSSSVQQERPLRWVLQVRAPCHCRRASVGSEETQLICSYLWSLRMFNQAKWAFNRKVRSTVSLPTAATPASLTEKNIISPIHGLLRETLLSPALTNEAESPHRPRLNCVRLSSLDRMNLSKPNEIVQSSSCISAVFLNHRYHQSLILFHQNDTFYGLTFSRSIEPKCPDVRRIFCRNRCDLLSPVMAVSYWRTWPKHQYGYEYGCYSPGSPILCIHILFIYRY